MLFYLQIYNMRTPPLSPDAILSAAKDLAPLARPGKREILRCAQDDMREGPVHGMRTPP